MDNKNDEDDDTDDDDERDDVHDDRDGGDVESDGRNDKFDNGQKSELSIRRIGVPSARISTSSCCMCAWRPLHREDNSKAWEPKVCVAPSKLPTPPDALRRPQHRLASVRYSGVIVSAAQTRRTSLCYSWPQSSAMSGNPPSGCWMPSPHTPR